MKKRATAFVFAALTGAVCANAQVVPVGGTGQALIARFYAGIDCKTAQPTGFGTAALFTPIMAGIPAQYLFQPGATVQDVTTATITGVFSKVQLSQSQNFNIVNTFLPSNAVKYYYHPNSSPKDWTDFDGFQAGQLIGVYQVQPEMFSTVFPGVWFPARSLTRRTSSCLMVRKQTWRTSCLVESQRTRSQLSARSSAPHLAEHRRFWT
jgi:hypothetical protein